MKTGSSEGFEMTPIAPKRENRERSHSGSLACTSCNWYIDGEGRQEEEMFRKASRRWFLCKPFCFLGEADASVNRT
jgi:hypothetical protein